MAVASPIIEFKSIPGFTGYLAGSDGRIWSCWGAGGRGSGKGKKAISGARRELTGESRLEDGRMRLTLRRDDGKYMRRYRSHFVLLAFVGDRPEKHEACHNDGNCLNDAATNLRWGTSIENKTDMVIHGTRVRGEKINTAKLTEEQVREIRSVGYPLKQHVEKYGVSNSLVSQILLGTVWTHIKKGADQWQ